MFKNLKIHFKITSHQDEMNKHTIKNIISHTMSKLAFNKIRFYSHSDESARKNLQNLITFLCMLQPDKNIYLC